MKASYRDILDRIPEKPRWFDEHAVPRFCEFSPDKCADIYCSEVVLAEIECQNCGEIYRVAFSDGIYRMNFSDEEANEKFGGLRDEIIGRTLRYGDPPNACCGAGAFESSIPRRVLEYWRCHHPQYLDAEDPRKIADSVAYFEWRRDQSLEIDITPDWAKDR
jgi:hypothetical protein